MEDSKEAGRRLDAGTYSQRLWQHVRPAQVQARSCPSTENRDRHRLSPLIKTLCAIGDSWPREDGFSPVDSHWILTTFQGSSCLIQEDISGVLVDFSSQFASLGHFLSSWVYSAHFF